MKEEKKQGLRTYRMRDGDISDLMLVVDARGILQTECKVDHFW